MDAVLVHVLDVSQERLVGQCHGSTRVNFSLCLEENVLSLLVSLDQGKFSSTDFISTSSYYVLL
jgi:hypothetical protein